MNDYVDRLWNSDAVACLDALKEADEAVETINRDMFSIIGDVAADVVVHSGDPVNYLKDVLKQFEQKYKKERSLKHMPGSYRSAKSAIVNAVKHGIALGYEDGSLKGKSALEKEIKQATKQQQPKRSKGRKTPGDIPHCSLGRAETALDGMYPHPLPTDMTLGEIEESLDLIEKHIAGIRQAYGV